MGLECLDTFTRSQDWDFKWFCSSGGGCDCGFGFDSGYRFGGSFDGGFHRALFLRNKSTRTIT